MKSAQDAIVTEDAVTIERAQLVDELVAANRILFQQGVVDAFGHVSARDPNNRSHFLLARHLAPSIVTHDDIRTFDFNGNVVDAEPGKFYTERYIHAAIYAVRPDVAAVVHSHSPAIIPFSITDVPLRPVCHVSAFLGEGVARFDTQAVAGDTDLLIRTIELRHALARSLGSSPVALMRGHGSVAVGASLRQAVYRAIYTELNARLQTEALRLGAVTYLTPGEVALMESHTDPTYRRPWDFWRSELPEREPPKRAS